MNYVAKEFSEDGIHISYRVYGTIGPCVIFFQGAWSDPDALDSLFKRLSEHARIVVPMIPPFGHSSIPPRSWSFEDYAVYFAAFTKNLKAKDITVIGHSFGGGIALYLAALGVPIRQTILFNPAAGVFTRRGMRWRYIRMAAVGIWYMLTAGAVGPLARAVWDIGETLIVHSFSAQIQQILTTCLTTNTLQEKQVKCSVYIYWGKSDELFPRRWVEALQKKLPKCTLTIVPGYHNWCVLSQDRTYDVIFPHLI